MVAVFSARRARRTRSDVSLVTEVIAALQAARVAGAPIPVEQLPVAVGLVNLHADVLASIPMRLASGRDRRRTAMLERPNTDEDRFYTVHKIVQSAMWTGNAGCERDGDDMIVLDPTRFGPEIDVDDPTRIDRWQVDGSFVARDDVLHLKVHDDPRHGPMGRSPFRQAREPLEMYGHAYRYLTDFFAGGGNPSTVLQRTGPGNATYSAGAAVEDWVTARQARRPAVLPQGWELQVPANNGEVEAIARVLEHSAAEVARVLNTPPSIANARSQSAMTYSTVAGEFRRWLAISLNPTWIRRLEVLFSEFVDDDVVADTSRLFDIVDPTVDDTPAAPATAPAPTPLREVS